MFSNRQDTRFVKDFPKIDRDPISFKKALNALLKYANSKPGEEFRRVEKEAWGEFDFLGIDFLESNRIFLQNFMNSSPWPEKEGMPPGFVPFDLTNIEIDHS